MNNPPLITVCITHFNDSDFIINTLYCLSKITKNSYTVLIRDNNSLPAEYQKLSQAVQEYNNVVLYRAENFTLTGSVAHGTSLNELVSKITTPYGAILDADCTFLVKSWDQILIRELNDRVKIAGTPAPRGSKKPQDFPLVFAMLFETATMKKLQIDFRSKDLEKIQDTGWELREKYLRAGYQGKILNMKNTRDYHDGPFRSIICAEYYLDGDYEHIFASHFARGSSGGAMKYISKINQFSDRYVYSFPLIGKYLLAKRCQREKEQWIALCHEIVNSQ